MRVAIFTDTFTPQVNGVAKTLERLTKYFQKEIIFCRMFSPLSIRQKIMASRM